MRKYHEGYALPVVLVVITVLCLVVASILPASLRTLNSQQASIQRMQAKYEAQGEIEKAVAALMCPGQLSINADVVGQMSGAEVSEWHHDGNTITFVLTSKDLNEAVYVACRMKLTGSLIHFDNTANRYVVDNAKLAYESYTISVVEETTGGAGG